MEYMFHFFFLPIVILHQAFSDFLIIDVSVPEFWLFKSGVWYITILLNKWWVKERMKAFMEGWGNASGGSVSPFSLIASWDCFQNATFCSLCSYLNYSCDTCFICSEILLKGKERSQKKTIKQNWLSSYWCTGFIWYV